MARGLQRSHGEIYANVTLTFTGTVIYGEINREEPAVSLVRDDRLGKRSAGKQILQIGKKSLIKGDYGTGLFPGRVLRARVENNMAAVFPNLINIYKGDVIAASHDLG